jgi:hypothetical protein
MQPSRISLSVLTGAIALCGALPATAEEDTYHPFTLSLDAGTMGAGGGASWRFCSLLGVRAGVDYFQFSLDRNIKDVDYSAKLRLLSAPLTLDVYPWKSSSFHVSLGVLINQNQFTGTGTATGNATVTLDGQDFTAADVGSLNLKLEQDPVNPYLSIGGNILYFDHAHHWALGGELGVVYTGDWDVSLTRSGGVPNATIDSALAGEKSRVQDVLKDVKFWPVLKLTVSYSF